jgi:hypothetical protein
LTSKAFPSSWLFPWFLHILERKERGDVDPHFHQWNLSLCEGNPLDLDLGEFGVILLCSSSLIPPIEWPVVLHGLSKGRRGVAKGVCMAARAYRPLGHDTGDDRNFVQEAINMGIQRLLLDPCSFLVFGSI